MFTAALVNGPRDRRGRSRSETASLGIGELYEYICNWIKREGAPQRPQMDSRVQGELVIARNPHVRARPLDDDVLRLLDSPVADVRLLAVPMLASVTARSDGQALTAREVLERLTDDDSIRVQRAAREALGAAPARSASPAPPDPDASRVAPAPPDPVDDPPRSAFARLEAPDAVPAGTEFELVVGLAAVQSPGVAGEELVRPPSSSGSYG